MAEQKPLRFPDWLVILQSASLLAWGLIVLFLVTRGLHTRFVDPAYGGLVVTGAIILILMGAAKSRKFLALHEHEEECLRENVPCRYKHRLRYQHILAVLVFLIPLLLLLGTRPKAPRLWFIARVMGGAIDEYQLFLKEGAPAKETGTIMDLQREDFQGKEFTVTGMLYPTSDVPWQFKFNQTYLVTVGMWSIASACRPVVLVVEYPPAYEPEIGLWVEVRGTVKSLKWDRTRQTVVLEADSLDAFKELSDPPAFPYFRATRSRPLLNPLK